MVRSLNGRFKTVFSIWTALIMVVGIAFIVGLPYRIAPVFNEQWIGAFMAMFLSGVFITKPMTRKSPRDRIPWYDICLAVLSLAVGFWITFNYPSIAATIGKGGPQQLIFGGVCVVLLLEAIRRTLGKAIFVILIVFLAYGKWSCYFPGLLRGSPTTWTRYINYLYLDASCIIYMLKLASGIGLAFIFFSQMLMVFGGADALTEFAFIAFGRTRGGPAKAAVVGSSLVGTVTGAPMSNVFLTGSVTIPMMMRSGWDPAMAGAVEAVSSTGGVIMPPVMGIAAFLIAERLSLPYATIALAAAIPALLYYAAVFIQVDLYAGKNNLRGLKKEELPNARETLKNSWTIIPIFCVLIYLLFIRGMSAPLSAVYTTGISLIILALQKRNRKDFFKKVFRILSEGGAMTFNIGCAMAAGGIIVGVVAFSGLGFTLGFILTSLGEKSLMLLLLGTAFCALMLGMGMPAVASYALTSALLASAITSFGISELAAHMFIFYFSVISNITPPIALAVFAAITLSGSSFWKTGIEACKLGILAYIVPFLFLFSPALLGQGSYADIILTAFTAIAGACYLGIALSGFLYRPVKSRVRLILFACGVAAILPVDGSPIIAAVNYAGLILGLLFAAPDIVSHYKQVKETEKQN